MNPTNSSDAKGPEQGNLRPETKHCVCTKCDKEWHYDTAKYCGMCGEKLKEAPAMSSLR